MTLNRTLVLFAAGACLILAMTAGQPSAPKDPKSGYNPPGSGHTEVNNFPVNGLPPLTYSPKNYTFYDEWISFFEAWGRCRSKGLRLATVDSYREYLEFQKAMLPVAGFEIVYWIAATNLGAKDDDLQSFYWITNDRPVSYLSGFQNWIDGVPPNIPNQCISVYLGSALWVYGPCDSSTAAYACEESQDV